MDKCLKILLLLPGLVACSQGSWQGSSTADWAVASRGASYNFAWRLSGNRQVAPVQVFDDGRHTWLQFLPGQTIPAIFALHAGTQHPVSYVHQAPYVVVQGKWPILVLQGGHLQARAELLSGENKENTSSSRTSVLSDSKMAPTLSHSEANPPLSHSETALTLSNKAVLQPKPYQANLSDENMRRVLIRWAARAGWIFTAEHWAVDVDIPLAGSADFNEDFKQSVRALLATTELGERPLQPCFYSNRVLRVISISQACDHSAVRAGAGW